MKFEKAVVTSMTLDKFSPHCKNDTIDFIWADIQGAQGDLIQGGTNTWSRVRYLFVEYDNSELYEGEVVGVAPLLEMLPGFEVVEDYGGDVLLKNARRLQ
jgi:hypothetical protein